MGLQHGQQSGTGEDAIAGAMLLGLRIHPAVQHGDLWTAAPLQDTQPRSDAGQGRIKTASPFIVHSEKYEFGLWTGDTAAHKQPQRQGDVRALREVRDARATV